MSTISSGTTLTTGYVVTSDTTGQLVIKTGSGATTALTIDASQNVSFNGNVSLSTPLTIGAGSAAAPSIAPTGDPNTGMFFPAADTIAFSEGGTEVLRINSSGQVEFTDGTVSLPAITNSGDTNTGIFFPAADTIAFSEGGVEAMRIDSSGNLGIGTSSPGEKLEVAGNGKFTLPSSVGSINLRNSSTTASELHIRPNLGKSGWLSFTEDSVADRWIVGIKNGDGGLFFNSGNPSSNTDRMVLDSSGNVGIGTTTPTSKLDVSGTVTGTSYTFTSGTISNPTLGTTSGNIKEFLVLATTDTNADSLRTFALRTANGSSWTTTGMRIQRKVDTTWMPWMQFGGASDEYIAFGTGSSAAAPTSVGERLRIDSGGNVGILYTTPTARLDVNGAIAAGGALTSNLTDRAVLQYSGSGESAIRSYGATGGTGFITFRTGGGGGSGDSERFRIGAAGQLGIGGANYGTSGQVLTSNGAAAAPSWQTPGGLPTVNIVTGTTQAAVSGNQYVLTNVAATTVTLPAAPSAGAVVWITVANGLATNVVARNGQNIQSLAEDLTLNSRYAAVQLRYADATRGWVFT